MSDILLFQTPDDGDINENFQEAIGLETAVYLSLFGGNEEDDGRAGNKLAWWANADAEPEERQISRFQNLLIGLPATSSNLKRLEDAALADLDWLDYVTVSASIPALNRVNIVITVIDDTFEFNQAWGE